MVRLMCGGEVAYRNYGGDSGGPVWKLLNSETDEVALYGIHQGGKEFHYNGGEHNDEALVMGIGNIRGTFGNFRTY